MTLTIFRKNNIEYGYHCRTDLGEFFFGFKNCSEQILAALFPHLKFYRAQQVHGDAAVAAPFFDAPKADAVWTNRTHVAPTVATADCLPILILHPHYCAAIHAGWRGVLNEIVCKTLKNTLSPLPQVHLATVMIGPHIQKQSFEVRLDVLAQFKSQLHYFNPDQHTQKHPDPEKVYIDLKSLVHLQLQRSPIAPSQIHELNFDTFQDQRWASYRREHQQNLRNLSFVARLK